MPRAENSEAVTHVDGLGGTDVGWDCPVASETSKNRTERLGNVSPRTSSILIGPMPLQLRITLASRTNKTKDDDAMYSTAARSTTTLFALESWTRVMNAATSSATTENSWCFVAVSSSV